jgi:hypothetical protein
MPYFRHPKTQNERKQDRALVSDASELGVRVKGRIRSGAGGGSLPTERDDQVAASKKDKYRGKKKNNAVRKARSTNVDGA